MDKSNKVLLRLLSDRGQSVVEYVLLLVVVVALAMTVLNNKSFKNLMQTDSSFFGILKRRMEYSYRHGREGEKDSSNYSTTHESYYDKKSGKSRYFSSLKGYPL